MEIALWIILGLGFIAFMVYLEVSWPKKGHKKIVSALHDAERLGNSDVHTKPRDFVVRWRYMLMGIEEAKKFKTESLIPKLQYQLDLMRPYEDVVKKHAGSSWSIDLPVNWP